MANFNNIKHEIDQNVNTNGVQAITGAILNETLKDMIDEVDEKKQDTLVAGSGIAINGNVISATGGSGQSYTAGDGIDIDPNNVISVDASDLAGSGLKEDSNGKLAVDPNEFQEKITAGSNIQISGSTISATDTTYSAGQGLDLNGTTFSVDYDEVQEKLESGQNIKTVNGYSLLGSGDIVIGGGGGGNYLPLEGGTLQNTASGEDTELKVIDGMDEDYVKIVAPESAGEKPHVEIFENGSGDTKIYYDHIERGSQVSIDLPSSSGTLALTTDIPEAGSGLIENASGEFEVDTTAIQEKLVAGQNITITGNVISASGGSGQSYVAGNGIDITGNTISVDNTVATTSDLSGYLPLTGGNLQSNYLTTELRVKSPSDDSYVYLNSTDTASPEIKFHRDIQNPTNGEVHEIDIKQDRINIERWDQSGNTWMADTLYFPQFKTGTIALTSDLAGKQDTLTAGTGISIDANNVISATGGSGSSLWTSGTGTDSLVGPDGGTASGAGSISLNGSSTASNSTSMSGGYRSSATAWNSFSYGNHATASRDNSISLGNYTNATVVDGVALGEYTNTGNIEPGSVALGRYNYVNASSLGNTSNTVFSIGNGQTNSNRSNALELTAGNSFYMTGVGGYTGSNSANSTSLQDVINGKQDQLTAGTGISIQNNVISATGGGGGTTYTASSGIDISPNNEISVSAGNGLTFNPNNSTLEVDWTTIPTGNGLVYAPDPVDPNFTYLQVDTNTIQEKLVAGSNITINGNTISATGGGSGSGLWSSGTGTNSLLSPSAVASSATASGTGALNAGYYNGQSGSASFANGDYSANFGTNNKVSYANSFASGLSNTTGGHEAFVGGGASNNAHGDCSAVIGGTFGTANGDNSVVIASGASGTANGDHSVAIGNATASGYGAIAIGEESSTNANHAIAIAGASATGINSVAIGKKAGANNENEIGLGFANKIYTSGTGSIKSAFTVGNGTFSNGNYTYSNGLELKGNSDFYVYGVGGFDGTNSYNGNNSGNRAKTLQEVLNDKQDTLTAGTGISISGNVISATGGSGASFTAGDGITIDQNNEISVDNSYLQSQYLLLEGGALQQTDTDYPQTSFNVYSPDSASIGYINSYSEDTSDPQNPAPAFVELGLTGAPQESIGKTAGIYLRSNGTISVDYTVDAHGTTEMVDLELPRKAPGQTYTIATLDDIQGGSGSSYTAGTGINIDANNVISNTAPSPWTLVGSTNIIGPNALSPSSGDNQLAFGQNAATRKPGQTFGFNGAIALGMNSQAAGNNAVAIGANAVTASMGALCLGYHATTGGNSLNSAHYATALGYYATATNANEIGIGRYNKSINSGTTAEKTQFTVGNGTADNARLNLIEAKQNNDIYVLGIGGFDGTNASQALTLQTVINSKQNQLVSGVDVKTINGQSIVGGGNLVISGGSGLWTSGTGTNSLLGPGAIGADGDYSIAAGEDSNAQANGSVALGGGVVVYDDSDPNNIINGEYGVAIGMGSTVETASSIAMMGGTASAQNGGSHSVAIGDAATAEGMYDVALTGSTSRGNYSFAASTGIAEGHYSTALSGGDSVGEGSLASGFGSLAYGYSSAALGLNLMTYSQANGALSTDPNAGEAAFGRYNYSEQNIIFSIGCGHHEPPVDPTDPSDLGTDVRENAITITNDGKIYLKGLGGYTGTSVSGCTDLVSFLSNL